MFERNIPTDELMAMIVSGGIIEEYPDDDPCPSVLILAFINESAYHIVPGLCGDHLRVITVCIPEEDKWIEYRTRRSDP